MQCRSIRVERDVTDGSDRQVVLVTVGNLRPVGCIDEVAWLEMSPGMARSVAADLMEIAAEIEMLTEDKQS